MLAPPKRLTDKTKIAARILVELKSWRAVKNASLVEVTPHPKAKAFVESVVVAIKRCQPYTFLPAEEYTGGWDKLDMTFSGNPSATAELKSGPLIDAREISRKLDQLRRERGKTDDTH